MGLYSGDTEAAKTLRNRLDYWQELTSLKLADADIVTMIQLAASQSDRDLVSQTDWAKFEQLHATTREPRVAIADWHPRGE